MKKYQGIGKRVAKKKKNTLDNEQHKLIPYL